jgi:hypothetical protein
MMCVDFFCGSILILGRHFFEEINKKVVVRIADIVLCKQELLPLEGGSFSLSSHSTDFSLLQV